MDLIPNMILIWYSDQCKKASTRNFALKISSKPWIKAFKFFGKLLRFFSLVLLSCYRTLGSVWMGGACRFEPSCSHYAVQAFQKYPFFFAVNLTFHRLLKCRPGGSFGYDPVPPRSS